MPDLLPLFPLGTVVYPGMVIPLHVFEERYRLLVRHLVDLPEGSPRRFGIIAIREGREVGADGVRALHEIGCVAELREVEAYPDGRYDIASVAMSRFRLVGVDESNPWLTGRVEHLAEHSGGREGTAGTEGTYGTEVTDGAAGDAESAVLAASVGRLLPRYRAVLLAAGGLPEDEQGDGGLSELPDDVRMLSYLAAALMVLDLADKQALLAAPSVAARLRLELALLRREAAVLRRLPAVPAVELVHAGYGLN